MKQFYTLFSITFLFNIQLHAQNVGIGESNPTTKLEIRGDSGSDLLNVKDQNEVSRFYIRNNGNVGIGVVSPNFRLHVDGNARFSERIGINVNPNASYRLYVYNSPNNYARLGSNNYGVYAKGTDAAIWGWNDTQNGFTVRAQQTSTGYAIYADGADSRNYFQGHVGINVPNPLAQLHVNGSVRFQGLSTGSQTSALMIDGSGNLSTRTMNINDWDEAHGWGNHASVGYLETEVDPSWNGAVNTTGIIHREGNVGIGLEDPSAKLQIRDNDGQNLVLENYSTTTGNYVGQYFKVHTVSSSSNMKGAIFYERTASWGRGSLHFATRNTTDNANVQLSDARMTVTSEGDVGIGTTNPQGQLHISLDNSANSPVIIDKANGSGSGPLMEWYGFSNTHRLQLNYNDEDYEFNTDDNQRDIRFAPNNSQTLIIRTNNRVGIGENLTEPSETLHVGGNIRMDGGGIALNSSNKVGQELILGENSLVGRVGFKNVSGTGFINGVYEPMIYALHSGGGVSGSGSSSLVMQAGGTGSSRNIYLRTANETRMYIDQGGNVGIGTVNPNAQLQVNGDIHINGVTPYENSAFNGAEIPLSIWDNSSSYPYQKMIVMRNFDNNSQAGLRRLGMAFHLSRENSETESNKMGAITVESENSFSNSPSLNIWTANEKRVTVKSNGNVSMNDNLLEDGYLNHNDCSWLPWADSGPQYVLSICPNGYFMSGIETRHAGSGNNRMRGIRVRCCRF